MNYAIGIDLGGSSIKAVTATPAGEALSRHNIDFDPDKNMEWAEKIRALVQHLQQERCGPAGSIGVSAPGLAAADGRSIAFMPERLQGLEGLDWTKFLGAPEMVPVLNDAHAALLGEAWVGAARGFENVVRRWSMAGCCAVTSGAQAIWGTPRSIQTDPPIVPEHPAVSKWPSAIARFRIVRAAGFTRRPT